MPALELHGILAAVSTPFTADGSAVDEATIRTQTDRLIGAGLHGLVPTGSTGEFTSLSPEEHRQVIKAYVDAADRRVPVIAGIGSLTTAGTVELAQFAEQAGADAVMVVPPFYDPLSFDGLKAFLTAVSDASSLPIVYYNIPGITGLKLTADEIAELGDIEHVDFLKDTSGDAVTLADLLATRSDRIKAFNGWDTLTFFGIASGAEAAVWGAAGVVPELAVELWQVLAEKGDLVRGRELWRPLFEISAFLESVNYVAGIKAGLELTGHPAGPARLPVQPLGGEDRQHFARLLKAAGVQTVSD